ncbi:MAG: universal stress protein [Desulfobacterales bacterium]
MYNTILVPLDGSERAEAILAHVEALAGRFHSKVIFLIVEEPPLMLEIDEVVEMSSYLETRQQRKADLKAYLARLQDRFGKIGIECVCRIGAGPVVKTIFETAIDEKADLVAMASHGWGGLARTSYGSVSAAVLNAIDRPLLVIRSNGR